MLPKWKQNEKVLAKYLGGKRQPFSGARWTEKGDIETPDFLIEVKTTAKESYALKLSVLKKIELEALHRYKRPALISVISDHPYAVVPLRVFKMLVEGWECAKNAPESKADEKLGRSWSESSRANSFDAEEGHFNNRISD